VTDRPTPPAITLGFLTVLQDASGYLGGYLLTNAWGRPLEFRLTTSVQPNRVQQILYGPTLDEYVHADLIGKTLVEKTATPPALIVTDTPGVLALRSRLDIPVVAVAADPDSPPPAGEKVLALSHSSPASLYYPAAFPADREAIEARLAQIDPAVDLAEPFQRIREAIAEARKMGVTSRAA
jgi:hypothetical protein